MKFLISVLLLTLPLMCSKNSGSEDHTYASESSIAGAESLKYQQVDVLDESSSNYKVKEQKLIKESFLRFETQDLDQTYNKIMALVLNNNGFVQDDATNKGYNQLTRRLIMRVPSNRFLNIIDSISAQVRYFEVKQITSSDVTEEFIDIEARLKAKQALELRYLELLNKANNVKDVIEIEKELSTIREEIEAKQGRLNYLQNKVALSTITIEFFKTNVESSITVSYGQKMWNAIKSGFNGLSFFFLGILHIWPFIIILIIVLFVLKKWIKRSNRKA
ncbi:DUF4349 domain-containing protein [Geojedonia litorea]|uniref:DUF4349 domain-containing protein n=1 Tax=Geojedonia litorea TaxID=1268269 RepID=A0ABV9N8A6_9FLAO